MVGELNKAWLLKIKIDKYPDTEIEIIKDLIKIGLIKGRENPDKFLTFYFSNFTDTDVIRKIFTGNKSEPLIRYNLPIMSAKGDFDGAKDVLSPLGSLAFIESSAEFEIYLNQESDYLGILLAGFSFQEYIKIKFSIYRLNDIIYNKTPILEFRNFTFSISEGKLKLKLESEDNVLENNIIGAGEGRYPNLPFYMCSNVRISSIANEPRFKEATDTIPSDQEIPFVLYKQKGEAYLKPKTESVRLEYQKDDLYMLCQPESLKIKKLREGVVTAHGYTKDNRKCFLKTITEYESFFIVGDRSFEAMPCALYYKKDGSDTPLNIVDNKNNELKRITYITKDFTNLFYGVEHFGSFVKNMVDSIITNSNETVKDQCPLGKTFQDLPSLSFSGMRSAFRYFLPEMSIKDFLSDCLAMAGYALSMKKPIKIIPYKPDLDTIKILDVNNIVSVSVLEGEENDSKYLADEIFLDDQYAYTTFPTESGGLFTSFGAYKWNKRVKTNEGNPFLQNKRIKNGRKLVIPIPYGEYKNTVSTDSKEKEIDEINKRYEFILREPDFKTRLRFLGNTNIASLRVGDIVRIDKIDYFFPGVKFNFNTFIILEIDYINDELLLIGKQIESE